MYPPDDSKVDSVQDELLTFNLVMQIVNISYNNLRAIHINFFFCVCIQWTADKTHDQYYAPSHIPPNTHTHTCHSNYMTTFGVHEMHVSKLMSCKLLLVGS